MLTKALYLERTAKRRREDIATEVFGAVLDLSGRGVLTIDGKKLETAQPEMLAVIAAKLTDVLIAELDK